VAAADEAAVQVVLRNDEGRRERKLHGLPVHAHHRHVLDLNLVAHGHAAIAHASGDAGQIADPRRVVAVDVPVPDLRGLADRRSLRRQCRLGQVARLQLVG